MNQLLRLKGGLIARAKDGVVTELMFTVASVHGAKPLDLDDEPLVVSYRDSTHLIHGLSWSWRFQGKDDGDKLLEEGELLQLTISLAGAQEIDLASHTRFEIYLVPSQGAILSIGRMTPSQLTPIFDLQ